ncbi:hypothetical protein [Trichlorobacter ammonificans]|uniref:Uncharacterized protein n=1 Tax=Trichlorobacter ammonificans TaxID=2916410 RepID=A0ABM9D7F0_9BACT|nr:hypothetical protein [Trichlorobacter ammonificans]CAH2030316.1 protein of unknown function [Trichlorobacter ammonificans]
MASTMVSVVKLRKELREAVGDYARLTKLHAVITEALNNAYGEEKRLLSELRQDVRQVLQCRVPD